MPKTKAQSVFFTAVTAWIMVYIMTLYNTVLATDSFTNATFLIALKSMWVEYIIVFLCAYFLSSRAAKFFCISGGKAGRSTHCDYSDHSGVYRGVSGGIGKHHWAVSQLWL